MTRSRLLFSAVVGSLLLIGLPSVGHAQFNRVFVSARSGSDANACNNINTPCQTFQGAVNQVAGGGSVIVLDTGGYGPVTIGKALTIDAPPGVVAFIHPPSGNAITVDAGASDVVVLRGLSLNVGTGNGIHIPAGAPLAALHIEHCVINGFNNGINIFSAVRLSVKDTTIRNSSVAINIGTGGPSNSVAASIDRCRLKSNQHGMIVAGGGNVTIRASNISGNLQGGLILDSHFGGVSAELNIERCLLAHNGTAVESIAFSGGAGTVRVSNSTVTNNVIGLRQNGGTLFSRINNTVEGNTTDTSGTITPYSPR